MPFFTVGFLLGTFVTKTVRAFVDSQTTPPPHFGSSTCSRDRDLLEEEISVSLTRAGDRDLPEEEISVSSTRARDRDLPEEEISVSSTHARDQNLLEEPLPKQASPEASETPDPSLPQSPETPQTPKRNKWALFVYLTQLVVISTQYIMTNPYFLGGYTVVELIALPLYRAATNGGSFVCEAAAAATYHVTQVGITAAAPTAFTKVSEAYSITKRLILFFVCATIAAVRYILPRLAMFMKFAFRLCWMLLIRLLLVCLLLIIFFCHAVYAGLLLGMSYAVFITKVIMRQPDIGDMITSIKDKFSQY
ncbi:hypothetical protein PAMP_005198 [Pampus punctatissimus]